VARRHRGTAQAKAPSRPVGQQHQARRRSLLAPRSGGSHSRLRSRHRREGHELVTALPSGPCDLAAIRAAFEAAYRAVFTGVPPVAVVEVVNIRAAVSAAAGEGRLNPAIPASGAAEPAGTRHLLGSGDVPVFRRDSLAAGQVIRGAPLVVALPRRRWRQAVVRLALRSFFRLTRTPLAVEAEAPLPEGGAILAANHASYLDGAVLAALCPGELAFTAKQELAGQLLAGPFLRRLGTVFLRRTDAAGGIADAEAVLPCCAAAGGSSGSPKAR
jgi:hypothetical protein